MGVVLQMVQQNDEKHEAGHTRLRLDYRELERRVMSLERAYTDQALSFTRMETAAKAPVDVMRIGLSLKLALSIIGSVVVVVLGAWSSAAWVKSDIQALRGEFALETRLNDERNQSMIKSIEELRKRQELTEIEIRNRKKE